MAKSTPKSEKVPPPPRVHKERINIYMDLETVTILDDLVLKLPEIETRSAAVRYLARMYKLSVR
jgi:hypothetical protein